MRMGLCPALLPLASAKLSNTLLICARFSGAKVFMSFQNFKFSAPVPMFFARLLGGSKPNLGTLSQADLQRLVAEMVG
jgi:hypothetical protein